MRILVVKLADIGDVLTVTPALRALRECLPDTHTSVLATPGSAVALRGLPTIDEIVLFDKFRYDRPWDALRPANLRAAWRFYRSLRAERFDAVLTLHHLTTRWGALKYAALALASGARQRLGLDNGRGWFLTARVPDRGFGAMHEVDYWLQVAALLGAQCSRRRMEIAICDDDRLWASTALAPALAAAALDPSPLVRQSDIQNRESEISNRLVALHPGSGGYILSRRWPPERFAAVADRLAERYGAHIVLVGGPGEEPLARAVAAAMRHRSLDLSGQTSITQLGALLERCMLFVGADSGVMHVAVAASAPVVALFGPTNEAAWGPYTPTASGLLSAIVRAPGTRPVMYVGGTLGKEREQDGVEAMAAITVEMVTAAAEGLLLAAGVASLASA